MSKRVRYGRLRTLADVKAERYRIDLEIARTKERLYFDKEGIKDMLRIEYWLNYISEKASQITGTVQWVFAGYNLVSSLVQKYRRRR